MLAFLCSQRIDRDRIITIHFLNRRITANRIRLCLRIGLVKIKIHIITGRHHDIMPHPDRFDASILPSPGHDSRIGSQTAFQNFIPADQLTAFRVQKLFRPVNHITLEFINALHPVFLHQRLALRTGFPSWFTGFIPSDMNILGREKFHHFCQYVFHKSERLVVTDTKITVLVWFTGTTQFRIGHQHLFRMPGKFYFRDYINMFGCCMLHNLPDILFRIITAICTGSSFRQVLTVMSIPPLPPIRLGTKSRFGSQFRIFVHLYTPSSGIRQVHMQCIQLIGRHDIQQLHHLLFRKEMPGDIQM